MNNKTNNNLKSTYTKFEIFMWILCILSFFALFLYSNKYIDLMLDSDMSSELVLGKLLADEHKIITHNWYYPTEIRVMSVQLFNTLMFYFFNNWHDVRVFATISMLLTTLLALFYLFKQLKLTRYFPLAALFIILPISNEYFDVVIKGTYYYPYIWTVYISLALVISFKSETNKKFKYYWIGFCIFTFGVISGLGGPRHLLLLYIPILISSLLMILFNDPNNTQFNYKVSTAAWLGFLGCLFGYLFNQKILYKKYSFLKWNHISYDTFSFLKFDKVFSGILDTYGFTKANILSIATPLNIICAFLIILIIYSIYSLIKLKSNIVDKFICLFYAVAVFIYIILYCFTTMPHRPAYNIQILIIYIPIIFMFIDKIDSRRLKYNLCLILLFSILFSGVSRLKMYSKTNTTAEKQHIVNMLLKEEVYNGYATFWNANVLTELSNGSIDVYTWTDGTDVNNLKTVNSINNIYPWLQLKSHQFKYPTGKVFVLLNNKEYAKMPTIEYYKKISPSIITQNYRCYIFNDYDELTNKVPVYYNVFRDDTYLNNGHTINDVRYIHKGGVSYGPYTKLFKGMYTVVIEGKNLDKSKYDCVSDKETIKHKLITVDTNNNLIKYKVYIDTFTDSCEFRVFNEEDNDIAINRIAVFRGEK